MVRSPRARPAYCTFQILDSPCRINGHTAGRPYTSSAVVQQNQIDPETKAAWPQLTHHQKKELLKPDKNRNNFKRMWKKDLQIKVLESTDSISKVLCTKGVSEPVCLSH